MGQIFIAGPSNGALLSESQADSSCPVGKGSGMRGRGTYGVPLGFPDPGRQSYTGDTLQYLAAECKTHTSWRLSGWPSYSSFLSERAHRA